ncbi:AAA family ATPase [Bradyrhizobium sp. Gha]|uniref:AAA family ATPase n=1 Tax=Bradyrhizobium sp. Gha TaxID=1855318 RepID=UPI0008E7638A|nr:AAA family ATPase [Bradyrhizobium sp. Gha]SFJ53244.1 AAA domain-containing protein [Bradyrhizobium sp. Gha]
MNRQQKPITGLTPNITDICAHLYAIAPPARPRGYSQTACIEIAYGKEPNQAQNFSVFEIEYAAEFAAARNENGDNVWVGANIRDWRRDPPQARSTVDEFGSSDYVWFDFDDPGDAERVDSILKQSNIRLSFVVTTGTIPHLRMHGYIRVDDIRDAAHQKQINSALQRLLSTDPLVIDSGRVMRLAGTIAYPDKDKRERGYVSEVTTFHKFDEPPTYRAEQLLKLLGDNVGAQKPDHLQPLASGDLNVYERHAADLLHADGRLTENDIRELLQKHEGGKGKGWHNDMLAVTWELIIRGYDPFGIRLIVQSACKHGFDDRDIGPLVDKKWAEFHAQDVSATSQINTPAPAPRFLTLAQWRERDLPTPDYLMSEVFSTTSRAILAGPTGLGKSNLAIAIGMRMAAGARFLHWLGRRRSTVLYIDGEMSRRLLRERLLSEEKRLLNECSEVERPAINIDGFHALNTEDIASFHPLNTRAGQASIERLIADIEGCDFVIFDNVMALISGPMIDEEAWAQTLPWVKSLTKRGIGQLWVHHTNDENKIFGTRTRAWQMDAVIVLTPVERESTDISFELAFTKARERRPDNRSDFDKVAIYLADDQWLCDAPQLRKAQVSRQAEKFYRALVNVMAGGMTPKSKRLHGRHAVHSDDWRTECVRLGLIDPVEKAHSARTLFAKHRRDLVASDRIACEGEHSWVL